MGRGRQKAKQTKVARELKYYSPDTNYRALEQELGSSRGHDYSSESRRSVEPSARDTDDQDDRWASDDR